MTNGTCNKLAFGAQVGYDKNVIETLPMADYSENTTSEYGNNSHIHQVRYAIRRLPVEIDGKKITHYYIFDKKLNQVATWAEKIFTQRHWAVGALQVFLGSINARTRNDLVEEWEKSLTTFTDRKKSELRYPN